ncbi:hypothetical protein ABDK56_02715 [Sphingomonas sp. ASV193]|uniref:hypothetical protein n=1 Tax=Sphingomonas sp. ASV193 TaxID=3144405 RepID=UPI0032E9183C
MSSKLLLVIAAGTVLLGACDTIDPVSGSTDPAFGEALAFDKALQTVNPDPGPPAPGAALPGDHGEKGVGAVERYRKDAVKEPQAMSTQTSSSGSGGGSK